jgi:hypothetical protein
VLAPNRTHPVEECVCHAVQVNGLAIEQTAKRLPRTFVGVAVAE